MATVVSIDGVLTPPELARVSVFDHGFLYGDSVYETLRTYGVRPFLLAEHLARLERSARLIGLTLPIGTEALSRDVEETVRAAANPESAVRIMVTRGEGPIGLDPELCPRTAVVVIARPFSPLGEEVYACGVKVMVARTARNSPRALDPAIKSGNFLNNILAAREARTAGAFEALMLNAEGNLAEGTQSNVFVVRSGVLLTPPPSAGILLGITRQILLTLCRAGGVEAVERDLFVSELYEADEIFLTSTLKGVLPVTSLGERPVGRGKVGALTARVAQLYQSEVERFLAAS